MAVDYANLFENVGEFVQRVNDYRALFADFDTDFSEIEADLDANGAQDILSGTFEIFEGFKTTVLGWISQMNAKVEQILLDRNTILEQINLPEGEGTQEVLRALHRDMLANSETIEISTVTIGSVSVEATNTSNVGSILVDATLDGVSEPGIGMAANWYYDGVLSELADDDTIYAQCIQDSESDGVSEGSEVFQLTGRPLRGNPFDDKTYGSGPGPTITVLQGASILTNCEFEDFTANVPDGWTLSAGTAGTTVLGYAVTKHRGEYSLVFVGNGAQTEQNIYQTVPAGVFQPRRRYLVGFWVQGTAATAAGTLTIQFEAASGYTAASSEKITMNAAALSAATSFTWKQFYINWPIEPPDDMKLVIKVTGTLTNAKSVYIDGGGVAPVTYFNGVNFVIYAGTEKYLKNDRISVTISNDDAGVFQTFFRKAFGVQLPSDASPTRADTLAT